MRMHNQGAGVFSDDAPVRKEVCMCVRACVRACVCACTVRKEIMCVSVCVCVCVDCKEVLWGYHLWVHVPFMNTCTDYEYMRRACGIIYGCMCRVWGI